MKQTVENVVLTVRIAVITHIVIPRANMAAKSYVIFVAVTWESNCENRTEQKLLKVGALFICLCL